MEKAGKLRGPPGAVGTLRGRATVSTTISPALGWDRWALYWGLRPTCKTRAGHARWLRLEPSASDRGRTRDQQGDSTVPRPPCTERLLPAGQCPRRRERMPGSRAPKLPGPWSLHSGHFYRPRFQPTNQSEAGDQAGRLGSSGHCGNSPGLGRR